MDDTRVVNGPTPAKLTVHVEAVDLDGVVHKMSFPLNPKNFSINQHRSVEPQYGAGKIGATSFKVGVTNLTISGECLPANEPAEPGPTV